METRELICINCPLGCALTVTMEQGKVVKVEGNTCPKGKSYGEKEVTNPTRIVTSSVKVLGGNIPVVSVKTASDIPKEKIGACMAALKTVAVKAPVAIGDVILKDICGTGADVVATRNVAVKKPVNKLAASGFLVEIGRAKSIEPIHMIAQYPNKIIFIGER